MTARAVDKLYLEKALRAGSSLNSYESRAYQITAAHLCAQALSRGNAVLTLPTGTGKTLICGMVATLFLRDSPPSHRVLFTAPRLSLLGQLRERTRWVSPTFVVVDVGLRRGQDDRHLHSLLDRGRLVFSMARWIANRFRSGSVAPERMNEIRLLIVDEFDAYLTLDFEQGGVRFHDELAILRDQLHSDCRLLLVSATTPQVPTAAPALDFDAAITASQEIAFRAFIDSDIAPEYVTVPESAYSAFVPHVNLVAISVLDPRVCDIDTAITSEIGLLLNWIMGEIKLPIDVSYIFPRLSAVRAGRLPLVPGRSMTITSRLRYLLGRLTWATHLADFVFEDMAAGFESVETDTSKYSLLTDEWYPVSIPRVKTSPSISGRQPAPSAKVGVLEGLIQRHHNERGVIFFRHVRILEYLAAHLRQQGLTVAILHGGRASDQNSHALDQFRNGQVSLLLITRDTGKRGLDLPEADYAVFYSPKSRSDVTWQEVSRIRGTLHDLKPTYLLYYAKTAEEAKWKDLAAALVRSERSIHIEEQDGELISNP